MRLSRHQLFERTHSGLRALAQLTALILLAISSGCSLYLDPAVCERDSDCGGGVCQEGICIGPRVMSGGQETAGEDSDMDPAGADDMSGAVAGELSGGDAGAVAVAGEMSGDEAGEMLDMGPAGMPVDADLPQVFTCRFNTENFSEQRVIDRDLPPDLNGARSWVTAADELELSVIIETPDDERWIPLARVYFGDQIIELNRDGDQLSARLELSEEGTRRARLVIEDEREVRCADQMNLTVDREPPIIELVSPSAPDSWIGALDGDAEVSVSAEGQDLTRITWELSRDGERLASAERLGSGLWSAAVELEEGAQTITLSAVDELDQRSTLEITLRYDPTPPGITIESPASDRVTIEASTLSVSGLLSDRRGPGGVGGEGAALGGGRVVVSSAREASGDGEELERQLTRADAEGRFNVTIGLAVGAQRVEVCAYDQADNVTCAALIVTRVEAEPCVNITSAEFSASADYVLTGDVCSSVTTLQLALNDQAPVEVALTDREFSYAISLPEAGVSNTLELTARAQDGASAVERHHVVWDNTPPLVIITTPDPNECLNDEVINVCGRVIDAESGTRAVRLQGRLIDLSDQVAEGEAWWEDFCAPIEANNGSLTLRLTGENGAGLSVTQSVEITVDRVAPSVTLPPANLWYSASGDGVVTINGSLSISGCSLAAQGFRIYKLTEDESGELERGRSSSPAINAEGEFTYREQFAEGAHQIEIVLRDRAGNERVTRYAFRVDRTPPAVTLIAPEANSISNQAELTLTLEASDLESGIDVTSAQATLRDSEGGETSTALTASSLGGDPERFELTATSSLNAGVHTINVVVSDVVGNESELEFTYTLDQTPPEVYSLAPRADELAINGDVIVLEARDALSAVASVEVNGVVAEAFGELWIAHDVPLDPEDPTLDLDASDEAGNRVSQGATPAEVNVIASPLVWRDPSRLGAPDRGYPLSNGSTSEDTGGALERVSALWWSSSREGVSELSGLFEVSEGGTPSQLSGVADAGGFSLERSGARLSAVPESRLPSGATLIDTQRISVNGVLTLFTLSEEQGETSGRLRVWQRASEVVDTEDIVGEPADRDDAWVEVRLGLPAQVNARAFTVGDVNGDGHADLICVSESGAILFTSQSSGEFTFEGAQGLTLLGIAGLDAQVDALWWVHLDDDATVSTPPDLVARRGESLSAWTSALSGGAYQYTQAPALPAIAPNRQVDGWLTLDWDEDGALDALAWSSGSDESGGGVTPSLMRRYTLENGAWSVTPITAEPQLPSPLVAVKWSDLDADQRLEALCVGERSLTALEAGGGTLDVPQGVEWDALPERLGASALIDLAEPADVDLDGDEDWLFGLRLPAPAPEDGVRGELWGLIAEPSMWIEEYAPIRILIRRGGVSGADASGVIIRVNRDDDLTFEEVYPARPFAETWLNTRGNGSVDLQVIFPDRGAPGGNTATEFEVSHGTTITIVDPQDD